MADNYALSYHEILMKVNNKKDKPGKLEVLRRYDTEQLRMFLKGTYTAMITEHKNVCRIVI